MRTITLEELLEAGCHFGHQVTRHNPKSRDFVFEARDNIHIIDLEKTKEGLENAAEFIRSVAQKPDSTLLVLGSKRQAETVVKEEIARAQEEGITGILTVTARWIGGTLTNFSEVAKNYKKLKDLTEKLKDKTERAKYTKKEISLWDKERVKLEMYYNGVKDMNKMPSVLFVIDTHLEKLAVHEANALDIPVVGIVDTNGNPDPIDYVIPANDDAVGSIKVIMNYIMDAWIEGKKKAEKTAKDAKEASDKAAEKLQQENEKAKAKAEAAPKAEAAKPEPKKTAEVKKAESKEQSAEGKKEAGETKDVNGTKATKGASTEKESKKTEKTVKKTAKS